MRAFDLEVRALGPRRSHSISRCTRFSKRFLLPGLRVEERLLFFQELAVIPGDAQQAVGIGAIQLHHARRNILQKVAVVADDNRSEGCGLEEFFKPLDGGEVEMVGGLIQQQDVRLLHQSFSDGEPLAPSAGKRFRWRVKVVQACASQRFGKAGRSLVGVERQTAPEQPRSPCAPFARQRIAIPAEPG